MKKILKVLAVNDPAVCGYVDQGFNILSNFNEDFHVDFNIVSFKDYYETMMEAFRGNREYDVVMVAGHLWLTDFANKGYLAPAEAKMDKVYFYEDILPIIREEIERDGVQYLYPSFCDGHVVLYRKSIVEKVMGKSPNKVISTDELIEMVSACNGYNGMNGIVLKAHPSEIFLDFLPYLRNEGADVLDGKNYSPAFNNEKGKKALKKYIGLKAFAPKDTESYGNEEVKNHFQQKNSVFAVTWGGQLGSVLGEGCIEKEDIGFSALKTSWNVTWGFGINQLSSKKAEANVFLKYITSKEVDRIIGGYAGAPVRKSTYVEDKKLYNWYDMHLELIEKYAHPLPKILNSGEKYGALYEALSKGFSSEITIAQALSEAEKRILELQKEEM